MSIPTGWPNKVVVSVLEKQEFDKCNLCRILGASVFVLSAASCNYNHFSSSVVVCGSIVPVVKIIITKSKNEYELANNILCYMDRRAHNAVVIVSLAADAIMLASLSIQEK